MSADLENAVRSLTGKVDALIAEMSELRAWATGGGAGFPFFPQNTQSEIPPSPPAFSIVPDGLGGKQSFRVKHPTFLGPSGLVIEADSQLTITASTYVWVVFRVNVGWVGVSTRIQTGAALPTFVAGDYVVPIAYVPLTSGNALDLENVQQYHVGVLWSLDLVSIPVGTTKWQMLTWRPDLTPAAATWDYARGRA